jgi:hypothetical protein
VRAGIHKINMPNESQDPTEESPLLEDSRGSSTEQSNPTPDTEAGQPNGDPPDVPIADEPSTARLVVILGSIYVGVFLAALGLSPQSMKSYANNKQTLL